MSVAFRYAHAALAAAQADTPTLPRFTQAIDALAVAVKTPTVAAAVVNPRLGSAQRRALVVSMVKAVEAPKALQGLLEVLERNGRLPLLPDVLVALQQVLAQRAGITEATVHVAQPLNDAQKISLKVQIKTHQKAKDVRLIEVVKPELVAGFRAFFGGLVWDTSVQGQLVSLKNKLRQAIQR